jgi:hypothetical protein
MFTRVSFSEETCSGSMSKSGLLCYNGPVSTLCCQAGRWQKNGFGRKMGILIFLPFHLSALPNLDDARQNRQKRAIKSILGHWASTVYSGIQGSPRQSRHLFPFVQSWLCLAALPVRYDPARGLLHVVAGWQPTLRPVRCNPGGGLFRKKLRWIKAFSNIFFGESRDNCVWAF